METTNLNQMCFRDFWIKSGTEGPRHDPYSYEEYSFYYKGKFFIAHFGLLEWIKVDGERQECPRGLEPRGSRTLSGSQ